MLSKEEIENMKSDLINLHHMLGKKPSISKNAINNALKYIDQLELDKQKLIEKLEEDMQKSEVEIVDKEMKSVTIAENRIVVNKRKYAQEILEIAKGENQVTVK